MQAALYVYVLQMRQRVTDDFFSSSFTPVRFVSLLNCAISKPGLDTVSENALNGPSIEKCHGWNGELHRLPAEEVKALLSLLECSCGGSSGGQLFH